MKEKMKKSSGMIDNRMVNDNHQQGIERVKQKGSMPKGQSGKMSNSSRANFKRSGGRLTPRQG